MSVLSLNLRDLVDGREVCHVGTDDLEGARQRRRHRARRLGGGLGLVLVLVLGLGLGSGSSWVPALGLGLISLDASGTFLVGRPLRHCAALACLDVKKQAQHGRPARPNNRLIGQGGPEFGAA